MNGASTASPGTAALPAVAAALAVAALAGGCGYRPLLRDARGPGGVSRISVPLVINDTEQVGVEVDVTGALVDRLDRYRGILVTDRDPEAVLRCTIRSVGMTPSNPRATVGGRLQVFRVAMVLDMQLVRVGDAEVLWQAQGLRREADYTMGAMVVGEDIAAYEELRREAFAAAGAALVGEGVDLMMGER